MEEVQRLRDIARSSGIKAEIAAKLNSVVGYGGLIHQFKNYVLRSSPKYADRVSAKYEDLGQLLQQYESMPNISAQDKADIDTIRATFTQYIEGVAIIPEDTKKGASVAPVDAFVK